MKIYNKIDNIFKIILLIFAQIFILTLTVGTIIFISLNENDIKQISNSKIWTVEMISNIKKQSLIIIWFALPVSLFIIVNNTYKLYKWLYFKKVTHYQKKSKFRKDY